MTTLTVDTKKVQKRKNISDSVVVNKSKKSCAQQDYNEMCDTSKVCYTVLEKAMLREKQRLIDEKNIHKNIQIKFSLLKIEIFTLFLIQVPILRYESLTCVP